MIDWHSHVLPCVDDGSGSTEESIAMLDMLSAQGIKTVVATPHFFANDESVSDFLKRRDEALRILDSELAEKNIEIIPGAEVKYYQGISKLQELGSLCIGDTDLLLLEMSFSKWTEYTVKELVDIASSRKVKIVLAHIERYLKLQRDSVWERLYDSGILMQVNASFFNDLFSRRKAFKMLDEHRIHFLGSDCHNIKTRSPQIGKAYEIIRKHYGDDFIKQMDDYGYSVLS